MQKRSKINTFVVIGSMWAGEGKGKITDIISQDADLVVRFQGGNNASQYLKMDKDKSFILSIIPAGIFSKRAVCLIANGAIFNPSYLVSEILELEKMAGDISRRLKISSQAHLIMPYHVAYDREKELARGKSRLGSNLTGVLGANKDKVGRTGIRVEDLLSKRSLVKKFKENMDEIRGMLSGFIPRKQLTTKRLLQGFSLDRVIEELLEIGRLFSPYIEWNSSYYVNQAIRKGKKVVFQGAQAALLDVEHGTYPYCTSTDPWAGGVCKGAGVSPRLIREIVGVVKAYTTRLREGPTPTEINGKEALELKRRGNESDGWRIGWLDGVALRYSAQLNAFTQIAVTKINALDNLRKIKICKAYKYRSSQGEKIIHQFPTNLEVLNKCEPVYEEINGWCRDTTGLDKYEDLPSNAKKYLKKISNIAEAPISMVNVGAERNKTIMMPISCF